MKIITFASYEFDPKKLTTKPECPELLRSKMVKEILFACPDDVDVKEFSNTTTISRAGKKVNISAWKFNLSDWPYGRPFNYFHKDGSEVVLVWGIQLFDNGKYISDVNDNTNLRCAMGYSLNMTDQNKAKLMSSTEALMWARQLRVDIRDFLSDADSVVQIIASNMPNKANVKVTNLTMSAEFILNGNHVSVSYYKGMLHAVIHHKYTEDEYAYGDVFSDYSVDKKIESIDEANAFDYQALWDDLYENRKGIRIYHGTLGT